MSARMVRSHSQMFTIPWTYNATTLLLCVLYLIFQSVRGEKPRVMLYDLFALIYFAWSLNHGTMTIHLPHGTGYLLILLWCSWVGDAAAYYAGSRFGKHKLLPQVSPGKSWEGVVAEYVTYATVMVCFKFLQLYGPAVFDLPNISCSSYLAIGAMLCTFGILGDLVESAVKRIGGAKDSGDFFPGHGGVLDRFDSFFIASVLLYYVVKYIHT